MIQDSIGIPTGSIDSITDFIDKIVTALVTTIFQPFMENVWEALVYIFMTLAPTLGFLLLITVFLYMFSQKYLPEGYV